jgi:hypothetical protein
MSGRTAKEARRLVQNAAALVERLEQLTQSHPHWAWPGVVIPCTVAAFTSAIISGVFMTVAAGVVLWIIWHKPWNSRKKAATSLLALVMSALAAFVFIPVIKQTLTDDMIAAVITALRRDRAEHPPAPVPVVTAPEPSPARSKEGQIATKPKPITSTLRLTFKNSPELTQARRAKIAATFDAFHSYLSSVGFDLPKEVPPLGVTSGAITMAWQSREGQPPESVYDAQIRITKTRLDNPDELRNIYALWTFRTLLGVTMGLLDDQNSQFADLAASLYACYYGGSYISRNVCDHDWQGKRMNNNLWHLRASRGQDFTDKGVFLAYKLWRPAGTPKWNSFDEYFQSRLSVGFWPVADHRDLAAVSSILASP